MEGKRIIIVGGGVAGVMAAEAARAKDPDAVIMLINDEPVLPYNRLNLTRMIAGEVQPDDMGLKKPAWYAERGIDLTHGQAIAIHRGLKEVEMAGGCRMRYDALVLATGANPFVPPIPGADLPFVSTLRTLAQATDMLATVRAGTRCVCIGGGLLGLELGAGLAKRGARVTILEGTAGLLSRQLASPASAVLREAIEAIGLSIMCNAKVGAIEQHGASGRVMLDGAEPLEADMVPISAGVRPNTSLASACGLEVGRGLKVDDSMRTGDPAIFAAGDVTEHRGQTYGLWQPAMEQGKVAGANAAGGGLTFRGVAPSAFLKVVGVDVFSIGDFMPGQPGAKVFEQSGAGKYARVAVLQGKVIGANLVGDTAAALTLKAAVERGLPVCGNQRLLDAFPGLAGIC
jgi:nitrite reductase (NADH) large subunit